MSQEYSVDALLLRLTEPAGNCSDVVQQLASVINQYINQDFQKLVQLLYSIDVDEQKVKQALQQNSGADAGFIIAQLIVERQLEKINIRQKFKTDRPPFLEEESW